jgi:HSP20 family molecular chaperone IbpA
MNTPSDARESMTPEFLELERRKRYGYVSKMEEDDQAYRLTFYMPTVVPPSPLVEELGLPREMPDYEFDLSLDREARKLLLKAKLTDPEIRKITGIVNSFPDRFFREILFERPVERLEWTYENKVLRVTVTKARS